MYRWLAHQKNIKGVTTISLLVVSLLQHKSRALQGQLHPVSHYLTQTSDDRQSWQTFMSNKTTATSACLTTTLQRNIMALQRELMSSSSGETRGGLGGVVSPLPPLPLPLVSVHLVLWV